MVDTDPMACGTKDGDGSAMTPLSRAIVGGEKGDEVVGMIFVLIPLTRAGCVHLHKRDP